jgi:outer membrane protein assembly factor BamB
MTPANESQAEPLQQRLRRAIGWALLTLGLITSSAVAVRASEPGQPKALAEYSGPQEPGSTFVFGEKTNGKQTGVRVSRAVGQSLMSKGVRNAQRWEDFYDNIQGSGRSTLSQRYQASTSTQRLVLGYREAGEYTEVNPPRPTLKLPLRPGTRWRWEGTTGNQKQRIDTRIVRYETIEAAGRRFSRCLRFDYIFNITDATGNTSKETAVDWFCPGVGLVRSVQRAPSVQLVIEEELLGVRSPSLGLGSVSRAVSASGNPAGARQEALDRAEAARRHHIAEGRLDTSRLAWSITRKANIDFPPVSAGNIVVIAEEDGNVSATDIRSGLVLWRVRLHGPVVASPVVEDDVVLVADAEKSLQALDLQTGYSRWNSRLSDVVSTAPAAREGVVVVISDDRRVRGLRLSDGKQLWQKRAGSLVTRAPAEIPGAVVVVEDSGTLTAFSLKKGKPLWSGRMRGSLSAGPIASNGLVIAADDLGFVNAFRRANGRLVWSEDLGGTVNRPIAAGRGQVVAAVEGESLVTLHGATGKQIWRQGLPSPTSSTPFIVGREVVALTSDGMLRRFDLRSGEAGAPKKIESPATNVQTRTDRQLGSVGGSLVVTLQVLGVWPSSWLYAFPTGADDASGVRFSGELRRVPVSPFGAPTLSQDAALFTSTDRKVYSVRSRDSKVVSSSDHPVPFVVPDADRLITQKGEDLVAVPSGGGKPLWTFPMGKPAAGTTVAVRSGVVFVPVSGKGLAALNSGTGALLWQTELPLGAGFHQPLALENGDVGYCGEGVFGIDGLTGAKRWEVQGAVGCLGPMAEHNGRLFAQVGFDKGSQVLAIDIASGGIIWTNPTRLSVLSGPAVASGVVVVPEPLRVAAYDASNGDPLWNLPLRTAIGGSPVVLGSRVVIAEGGREEDFVQRDFNLTVLDLKTGRFLGSWEPPSPSYSNGRLNGISDTIILPVTADKPAVALLELKES